MIFVFRACQAVLTGDYSNGAEELREMACAAYNCLIVVVCSTQKDVKFYVALLLPTREDQQRRLLENLVVSRLTAFVFPQELERPLRKKAQFEAVMQARRDANEEEDLETGSAVSWFGFSQSSAPFASIVPSFFARSLTSPPSTCPRAACQPNSPITIDWLALRCSFARSEIYSSLLSISLAHGHFRSSCRKHKAVKARNPCVGRLSAFAPHPHPWPLWAC